MKQGKNDVAWQLKTKTKTRRREEETALPMFMFAVAVAVVSDGGGYEQKGKCTVYLAA